jgi:hypothetical protein
VRRSCTYSAWVGAYSVWVSGSVQRVGQFMHKDTRLRIFACALKMSLYAVADVQLLGGQDGKHETNVSESTENRRSLASPCASAGL